MFMLKKIESFSNLINFIQIYFLFLFILLLGIIFIAKKVDDNQYHLDLSADFHPLLNIV